MDVSSDFIQMINSVKEFHLKHGFDVATKNRDILLYRTNLLVSELGEISDALTKGKSDSELAEEHADLFILLLGNCIVMDIDLHKEFYNKIGKIMSRPVKQIGNYKRVSDWKE